MQYLFRHAHVHQPKDVGIQDILVAGSTIVAMGKGLDVSLPDLEVIDLHEMDVIPGLIDQHVHIIGGGGEDGPESRVQPLAFSDCAKAGVTALVGTLGTDCHTKTIRDLFASTMALRHQGLHAWCLTGSYEYPSPTLTGSVADDLVFVDPVIGCKIAISDQRCSCPNTAELARLASQCRLGGLIGGKVGELHLHVGADPRGIEQLFQIAKDTPIPVSQFRPTHMGRHLEQAKRWIETGGYADITTGGNAARNMATLASTLDDESWNRVTMSSDSNGSMPKWNEKKEIIGMDRGRMTALLQTIRELVEEYQFSVEKALLPCTATVAQALRLKGIGIIEPGNSADFVVLDTWKVETVLCRGQFLAKDGTIVRKGMFEE
ncbi:MAG: beta-aspartyl-peptidase [Sphaerochaetaceae bacterium]